MKILQDKALLLKLKKPEIVLNTIQKSKLIKKGEVSEVLVKWGINESIALSNLKIRSTPSPIRS